MNHEPPLAFPVPDDNSFGNCSSPPAQTIKDNVGQYGKDGPTVFWFHRGEGTHHALLQFLPLLPEFAPAATIDDEAVRLLETLREIMPGSVFEALCKHAVKEGVTLTPRAVPGIVEAMGRSHHVGMVTSERILEGEQVTVELGDGSKVRMLLKPAVFRRWELSEQTMRRAQLLLRQGHDVAAVLADLTRWDADVEAMKAQGAKLFLQWFLRQLDAHGFYAVSRLLQAAVAALLLGEDKIELPQEEIPF